MVVHSSALTSWQTFRQTFDQKLQETLQHLQQELPLQEDPFIQEIFEHILPLAEQGKRVRPYIASVLFEAAGGNLEEQPWEAWIGLELIHLFALIHDDIIDHGLQRHNVETMHTFVARRLKEQERNGNHVNVSESQALLAGDLTFTWAMQLLTQASQRSTNSSAVSGIVFELLREVILGQALDVDLTTRLPVNYEMIEKKMLLKTARYTFTRPMQLGTTLGATNNPTGLLTFCQEFGDKLGLAFQLQDDWFDVLAAEQRTGKTGYRDLEEAQQTFFSCFVFTHGTLAQQERLSRLLGHPLTKEEQEAAYTLFTEVDAMKQGERLIEKYYLDAERILNEGSPLSEKTRQTLQAFVTFLRTRSA